ncbi:hypothetical protein [Methylocaldum sp.]|uniref:hypothetical protein n=1 Tax=Methylocaldum sp. TaxID=1969727 RepID=UPI002D523C4C|nr:hypothetical protein [Methylocaldum sp.]HYE36785.1 hypothetical protein [Methylocaldum sp.]
MFKKASVITACVTVGMIVSASASADMVIKSGGGRTQTVMEASIYYGDLGGDDINWPAIVDVNQQPIVLEGDTQLGEMVVKLEGKTTLTCAVLGKGYDLQVVPGVSLPTGQPLVAPSHLRHVITCTTDSLNSELSRLSTDGDTPVSFSPVVEAYPCKWEVTEIMYVKAPRLTVGPIIDAPGNTGLFSGVTGGTLTVMGTIDACTGQNVFTSITGTLLN